MRYEICQICHLSLPINYLVPVIVIHQGKRMKVLICESCKKRKEQEAKEK